MKCVLRSFSYNATSEKGREKVVTPFMLTESIKRVIYRCVPTR
jgi:hypothetical protein